MRFLTILTAIFFASCNFSTNGQTNSKVGAKEFNETLKKTKDAILLDVRTPQEYSEKHLEGSLNVDFNGNAFDSEIDKLDKSKTVFIYCLSSGRSTSAAEILVKKGFKNIYNLDGGILAWTNAGLPVVSTNAASSETDNGQLNTEKYLKLVTKDKLVLVDFNAVWCGPCKVLKPIVKRLEKKHASKMELLAIDVDQNPLLSNEMNISGIPLLILYKNGKEVWRNLGLIQESELEAIILAN